VLGPLERTKITGQPTQLRMERDQVSEKLLSLQYRTMDKVQIPVIPSVINLRQNHSEYVDLCSLTT
jgi:hypothetical protein